MLSYEFIAFVIWHIKGEAEEQGCYNVSEVKERTVNTAATIIKVLQVDRNMGLTPFAHAQCK